MRIIVQRKEESSDYAEFEEMCRRLLEELEESPADTLGGGGEMYRTLMQFVAEKSVAPV